MSKYKKYTICPDYASVMENLKIINISLSILGKDIVVPNRVTGNPDGDIMVSTNKWYYLTPEDSIADLVPMYEGSDINPNHKEIIYYKIYSLMTEDNMSRHLDWTISPHSLNYKTGLCTKLQPNYNFDIKGNLVNAIYYKYIERDDMGNIEYFEPIMEYNCDYIYNDNGYCTHRLVERKWMLSNGLWSDDIKISRKEYDRLKSREIGVRRRKNIISNLLLEVGFFILMTEDNVNTINEAELTAMTFMAMVGGALSVYYESGNKRDLVSGSYPLETLIINSTNSWMENKLDGLVPGFEGRSIRDYSLYRINEGNIS